MSDFQVVVGSEPVISVPPEVSAALRREIATNPEEKAWLGRDGFMLPMQCHTVFNITQELRKDSFQRSENAVAPSMISPERARDIDAVIAWLSRAVEHVDKHWADCTALAAKVPELSKISDPTLARDAANRSLALNFFWLAHHRLRWLSINLGEGMPCEPPLALAQAASIAAAIKEAVFDEKRFVELLAAN